MLTPLQQQKATHNFNLFDQDKNGYIERGDYEAAIHAVGTSYGYQPGTPTYAELHTYFMGLWESLAQRADQDHDGRVSLDEFLAAQAALLSQREPFMARIATIVEAWYKLSDRDGDGFLSQDEYVMNIAPFGVSAEDARESFKQLDRHGTGLIAQAEMIAHLEEYYYSDDPEARGNWVFGRFQD